jgi:hypothetical protein
MGRGIHSRMSDSAVTWDLRRLDPPAPHHAGPGVANVWQARRTAGRLAS